MTEPSAAPDAPDADDVDALLTRFVGITRADDLPEGAEARWRWLRATLTAHIERMIEHDVGSLPQALYRVDVDERSVDRAFAESSRADLAPALAELVLERMARILRTRRRWEGLL